MASDDRVVYPGFNVSFLVPPRHDEDELEEAVREIKRDLTESAARHLPKDCQCKLDDVV